MIGRLLAWWGLFLPLVIGFPIASLAGPAPDADGDGVPDVFDKCTLDSRNTVAPATCDTDTDGYGNVCDADFDQNFTVLGSDYSMFFLPAFKGLVAATRGEDMDCNGAVLGSDYSMYFLPKFKGLLGGAAPGPSGLACAGQAGCGATSSCNPCDCAGGQACVNGACTPSCTNNSQCCSPLTCVSGACSFALPP